MGKRLNTIPSALIIVSPTYFSISVLADAFVKAAGLISICCKSCWGGYGSSMPPSSYKQASCSICPNFCTSTSSSSTCSELTLPHDYYASSMGRNMSLTKARKLSRALPCITPLAMSVSMDFSWMPLGLTRIKYAALLSPTCS